MACLYLSLCLSLLILKQCSSFSVKYALDRVDNVESRLEAMNKLRRADLAEIFGKIHAISNKMCMLNTTNDNSNSERKMEVINEKEKKEITDYLLKGAASEKLENVKTRKALTSMVKLLAANYTNNIVQLQNILHEMKNERATLVNKDLLNTTMENTRDQCSSQIETLKSELEIRDKREQQMMTKMNSLAAFGSVYNKSLERLEKEMTDKWASEIESLKSELELRKKLEETLLTKFDSLKTKLESLTLELSVYNKSLKNTEKETLMRTILSCSNLTHKNQQKSGVYVLKNGIRVYCDQDTDGGGWTVFQRRKDGSVDFERKWSDYKAGFGDVEGEFWLGNDNIHALTATGNHELRIDIEDFEGSKAYAKYNNFKIKSESEKYALEVSGYSGDAGDSLTGNHHGMEFSTTDRDNDKVTSSSCSKSFRGAWWYGSCHDSNLNGFYYHGANSPAGKGIVWYHWKNINTYSLKFVEMKLR